MFDFVIWLNYSWDEKEIFRLLNCLKYLFVNYECVDYIFIRDGN